MTENLRAHDRDAAAETLDEFWSQRVLAEANGSLLEIAKGLGSTEWHSCDDQDEIFVVTHGRLIIQLRDGEVVVSPGELFVGPTGVEHPPRADEETRFLIVGRSITSNTTGGKPAWSHRAGRRSDVK